MTNAEKVQYWDNKVGLGGIEIEVALYEWERSAALEEWQEESRSFWIAGCSSVRQSPTLSIGDFK